MTDRHLNGQTEFPLIDSTPERGRVKIRCHRYSRNIFVEILESWSEEDNDRTPSFLKFNLKKPYML